MRRQKKRKINLCEREGNWPRPFITEQVSVFILFAYFFFHFFRSCALAWFRRISFTNSPAKSANPRIAGGENCETSDTKMAEGVSALTFPMLRESESASRLKAIITDMIPLFSDDYSDDVLSVRYLFHLTLVHVRLVLERIPRVLFFRIPGFTCALVRTVLCSQ